MKLIDLAKRISFAAIALSAIALSSCKPDNDGEVDETATIKITPASLEFDHYAQEADVTVESSEDWTLVGSCDWVTPSTVQGQNGSNVTFSVSPNLTGKSRSASFKFTVTGTEEELKIKQNGGELEMNMALTAVACTKEDITLSLEVESKDIELFCKWGIIYSLSDNKEDGEEVEIEGVPAVGTKEVKVIGLTANTTYYFWAYAEDIAGTRYYTETPVEKATEAENTGSGDGAGNADADGDGIPDYYAEMKENSIAITWADENAVNNLTGITMETLFRWDAFNTAEGIDTMFGVEGGWLVRCMNNFHWIPEDGWYICTPGGSLCFAPFVRENSAVTDWKGMTQGVWHHLAITYDAASGAMAVYIDGTQTVSGTYELGNVNLLQTSWTEEGATNTFHIGKSYNTIRWFYGAMSEVRIWSRALTAEEINAEGHFYGVDPSTAQGLLAYWKLDGTGTHVEDYSGNGNHGTAEKAF